MHVQKNSGKSVIRHRNKCVRRIHWTLESSRDYGRRIVWVVRSPKPLSRSLQGRVWGEGDRRCARERFVDPPSLEGYTFVVFVYARLLAILNEIHVCLRSSACRKRPGGTMSAQMTEIARVRKSSNRRAVRTRTVSTRVTQAKYAALQ